MLMYRPLDRLIGYIMGTWLYYQTLSMYTYYNRLLQSKLVKNKFGNCFFFCNCFFKLAAMFEWPHVVVINCEILSHPFDTKFFHLKHNSRLS